MWAAYITNFVFWVGIAHCGTLVSAVLYLFRSHFRRAVYRVAEAMTVFGVLTAGLFPLLHTGRPWFGYWLVAYPNQRNLWPNFRSPLEWDVFAVTTYLTISSVFFLVGLIPDCAAARDRAKHPLLKLLYQLLSFGWIGHRTTTGSTTTAPTSSSPPWRRRWCSRCTAWCRGTSRWRSNPGWHSTLFAPYFVAGAIFSGVALVINLLIPIRKTFKLEHIVTLDHMEKLSKLVLLTSCMVGYSYLTEFFMAWYGPNKLERDLFWYRLFGHYWWAVWIMFTCNVIFPISLWFKQVRRNMVVLFVLCLFVNVGMWFERFVIIVTSLARPINPAPTVYYRMSWTEAAITAGAFAWFFMYFLIFVRVLPAFSIAEIKETLVAPMRRKAAS